MLANINIESFLENLPVVITITDFFSGEYLYVNEEFCEVLGYSKNEVIGKTIQELNIWSNIEDRKTFIEKLKDKTNIKNFEAEFIRKDGKKIVGIVSFFKYYINNRLCLVTIGKDITLLKEKEVLFNTIFNNIKVGILVADVFSKEFFFANPTICKMLGYELHELLTLSVYDIHPKDKIDNIISFFESQAEGEILVAEDVSCLKKDGTIFYADICTNKITIDNRDFNVGVFLDVTERYNKELALKETKEFLEAIFESIQDGISVLSKDLTIKYVNSVMEKWYSESMPLVGKKCYQAYHNKNEHCIPCPSIRCITSGKTEFNIVPGYPSPNSPVKWLELYSYPIKDKNTNEVKGIVEFVRDITDKVNTENEIAKLKKLEALGILAGGIAHDFNNLLTGIFGNLEIAKLKMSKKDPAYKYIENSIKSLERAKNLTRQLLTFSKGGEPILDIVDLKDLIKTVVTFDLTGSNIKPHFKFPNNLWHVKADETQISQVISNLTINAKEAMPDGGNIYIQAENIENYEIQEIGLKGDFVKITFQDEGIGIPEKNLEKIFDPFFSTKKHKSGLGLSISYSIIKRHNGYIRVNSKERIGTTFEIFLPAVKEKILKHKKKKSTNKKLKTKNLNILIVDDEEVVKEVLKEVLELHGFKVEEASNSKEAIEKYKNNKFDVVLLDLTLPGDISGAEIGKKILQIDKNAKIIITTGYSEDPVLSNYKDYGFHGAVTKPFTIDKLISEIKKVLY